MSASPSTLATASAKRPLDDESSPSGMTDQPDAKRPALDKLAKEEDDDEEKIKPEPVEAPETSTAEVKTEEQSAPVENGHEDHQGDTVVPDAPNGTGAAAAAVLETQPIQSTGGQYDRGASQGPGQHQGHQDETGWIHVRAVISSAEAATVIGKGGENVSLIRRHSGAKCTVSDYSRGAVERVLTVSGLVDAAAKVWRTYQGHRSKQLMESGVWIDHSHTQQRASRRAIHEPIQDLPSPPTNSTHTHRIDHWQVWCAHP